MGIKKEEVSLLAYIPICQDRIHAHGFIPGLRFRRRASIPSVPDAQSKAKWWEIATPACGLVRNDIVYFYYGAKLHRKKDTGQGGRVRTPSLPNTNCLREQPRSGAIRMRTITTRLKARIACRGIPT